MDAFGSSLGDSDDVAWNQYTNVQPFNYQRMLEDVERLRAQHEVSKSRTQFRMLGSPPCSVCNHKAEYREGPPETMVVCKHQWELIKRISVERTDTPRGFLGEGFMGGYVVEVVGS